jgi:CRP-like cAMP-binding protein
MISPAAEAALRNSSLFAGFTGAQLEVVPKMCIPHDFDEGDVIINEHETDPHSMWLILEGTADVIAGGAVVRQLGPGDHVGEMALLTGEPRSASVVADSPVTALEMSPRHLQGLIASDPEVAMAMLSELGRRLRRATQSLAAVLDAHPEAVGEVESLGITVEVAQPIEVLGPIEYALQLN